MPAIVQVESLVHEYGARRALAGVTFDVAEGECFGLLGPNGGGKTTLFRVLTTLLPPTGGRARICGHDVTRERDAARATMGVVFQSPSLDLYLTVQENLLHGGHLYGMQGPELRARIDEVLGRLGLTDRRNDLVKKLSGGMRRRAEIAKGLLHRPRVLILDEPSTGLDPAARRELWQFLQELRGEGGVTILVTTHFMDEADRCDRIAILDRGSIVACGRPGDLKRRIGGDCITMTGRNVVSLRDRIAEQVGCPATVLNGAIRIETSDAAPLVARLMESFGADVESVTLSKPTLEDVFVHETGRRFENGDARTGSTEPIHGVTR